MTTYAQIELDFFGIVPTETREHDATVFGPVRIRQAFVKLETPVLDFVAGQYFELFGWGSYGFYPGTVAFLGVPGQVFHRNPQLRLEKRLDLGGLEIMAAAAAVRPGQRDSGIPDVQAGLKFAATGWTGPAMQGFGRAAILPAAIGVSGLYRQFEVPVFRDQPGSADVTATGWGAAANVLLPIIPADSTEDRGNSLTITGEFSTGTGIADMYTGMDGGARFPVPGDPSALGSVIPVYQQNVDNGLVTFDRNLELQTINWTGFVVGLQYYFPIDGGRLWLTGIYSKVESDNIKELTPAQNHGAIFTEMEYMDASLTFEVTPAVVLGFSFQTVQQSFGDEVAPTPVFGQITDPNTPGLFSPVQPGTGGEAVTARNNRVHLSTMFFF
jgi:hypothetical protein